MCEDFVRGGSIASNSCVQIQRRWEGNGLYHPLYTLLHNEPNPEMTSFVFRETLMSHLLIWGNAYAQIIRSGKGEVLSLYPLLPNKMSVERDSNGVLYFEFQKKAIDINEPPDYAVHLFDLAGIEKIRGNNENAIYYLEKAIELWEEDTNFIIINSQKHIKDT